MPFFIRGKKKREVHKKDFKKNKKDKSDAQSTKQNGGVDEEIESDSEEEQTVQQDYAYSSESEEETVQEKRLRLAHQYLDEIEKEEKKRLEQEEVDRDVISHRLKEEVLEQAGRLKKLVADDFIGHGDAHILACKEHSRTLTCVVISSDDEFIFSASEDCNIVKWSLKTKSKLCVSKRTSDKGHKKKILALALTSDRMFLASGDTSSVINIWNPDNLVFMHTFNGHKKGITGLTFRRATHQLFSCSEDASVKIWNLDEMSYVETLFGHQYGVTSIDSLNKERAITSGGRDNSIRIWKVVEESHLILNGNQESIDCVRLLNEENFISGGEDGSVCLWSSMKKKPVYTLPQAHGVNPINNTPNWVICIATYLNTDLFASSSWNGQINVYKCSENFKTFSLLFNIPLDGNINCMVFTSDGLNLIVGVGQEHRLGRWNILKYKNCLKVIPLRKK